MTTNETATLDGVTHLNSLEVLNDLLVDGNLTVIGSISGEAELTQKQIVTAITTVGAGTLTAAGLVGGFINRTGPVAAYTDTTDTAANIIAALPGAVTGSTIVAVVKNATAFIQTIAAGTGVTLPATLICPAFSEVSYLLTVTSATAVSFSHISTQLITSGANQNPYSTAISTVGAGTLTAAAFVGSIIVRSGSQSGTPFTDTTDTAANIIAACPNLVNKIGTSMLITYSNTTNATATLTGGTGVTVSTITSVPAGKSARFILTYTAAATMTMVGFSAGEANSASTSELILAGSTSGTTTLAANATAGSTTITFPAATDTVAVLGTAQTFTAVQTFTNSDIALLGSSTGKTTFTSANSGASNFTLTVPAVTDTLTANAATQTLSAKTLTDPIMTNCTKASAQNSTTSSTALTNIAGLVQTVAVGTYKFRLVIPCTTGASGGIKVAFKYTTTVLSAIDATGLANTSAAVATQHTTTTTDQTSLISSTTNAILGIVEGTMVVSTGGTVQAQWAQNVSDGTATIALIGSSMEFTRIA